MEGETTLNQLHKKQFLKIMSENNHLEWYFVIFKERVSSAYYCRDHFLSIKYQKGKEKRGRKRK